MTSLVSPSPSPQAFAKSCSPTFSVPISLRSASRSPSAPTAFAPRSRHPSSPRHAPSAARRSHHIVSAPAAVPAPTTPVTRYKDSGTQYTPCGDPPTAKKLGELGSKAFDVEMQNAPPAEPRQSDGQIDRSGASATLRIKDELALRPTEKSHSDTPLSGVVASLPLSPKQTRTRQRAKSMPKDYMKCNPLELGVVIADMLIELIQINDEVLPKTGILTRFHSRAPPTISVRDYLDRLIFHATLSPPLLLAMVFYIDRLCLLYPAFTINSLTVHRFLITAATVAAKGLSDSFWTNHTYARVGGVSTKELAMLELDFLDRLDWNIVPKAETLEDYYRSLVTRADDYILEEGDQNDGEPADTPSGKSEANKSADSSPGSS